VDYQDLIIKFLANEISEEELVQLDSWLKEKPENRHIFDNENELWQETSFQTKLQHYKIDKNWIDISLRLGLGKKKIRSVTVIRKISFISLVAAASLASLIAIGSLFLWINGKHTSKTVRTASTIISTREGEKAHIYLPDSTEIVLNSGSTIRYDGNYNKNERVVQFSGEAFFDVSTNPKKPFIVKLDRMNITATGTRFNIFSYNNEDRVETTLEEGIIQVSILGVEPITMKSGQQVVYFVKSKKVSLSEVATDTYVSWKENKLRFNDTPFEEVLRRIGRKYNVTFEITNRNLLNLRYTATFIDESIEEVMQMLKAVSPITYKIYNLTSVNDKQYRKPRIVVGEKFEKKPPKTKHNEST
jgi:transmembrane sensor